MKKRVQNKLHKLNKETDQLLSELDALDQDSLRTEGNGWSIMQVLNHLEMAERLSLGYMEKKLLAGVGMSKTTLSSKFRMFVTSFVMQSSLKWKAPKPVANPKNEGSLGELRERWVASRGELAAYIERYPKELLDRAVYKHPLAGRLGLEQAIDSFIYHVRHHKHQVKRIRKELQV